MRKLKRTAGCFYVVVNRGRAVESQHSTVKAAKKAAKRLSAKKRDGYAGISRHCGTKTTAHFVDCFEGVCSKSRKKRGRKSKR